MNGEIVLTDHGKGVFDDYKKAFRKNGSGHLILAIPNSDKELISKCVDLEDCKITYALSDTSIKDYDDTQRVHRLSIDKGIKTLGQKPDTYSIIIFDSGLNAGVTINTSYIRGMHDRRPSSTNESTILQSLIGRASGWGKGKDEFTIWIPEFINGVHFEDLIQDVRKRFVEHDTRTFSSTRTTVASNRKSNNKKTFLVNIDLDDAKDLKTEKEIVDLIRQYGYQPLTKNEKGDTSLRTINVLNQGENIKPFIENSMAGIDKQVFDKATSLGIGGNEPISIFQIPSDKQFNAHIQLLEQLRELSDSGLSDIQYKKAYKGIITDFFDINPECKNGFNKQGYFPRYSDKEGIYKSSKFENKKQDLLDNWRDINDDIKGKWFVCFSIIEERGGEHDLADFKGKQQKRSNKEILAVPS